MRVWLIACTTAALATPVSALVAQADAGRITGQVTSADGAQPMVGATISIVGARLGAIAGAEGRYTVTLPAGRYRVRATMIGYAPVVVDSVPVTAGGTTPLNFKLEKQALQLNQVVVVGYGTQRREDVTGAVGTVKAEDIATIPTTSAIDAIKGRVPGVDIRATGYKPGDQPRVQIRGQRSLTASNDPLYVLDGIPMAGGIGDLNPTDIESIDILKDASATAIYGSRGANGVVLITSKKGRAGDTRISYDGYIGRQDPLRTIDVFNGAEFAQYKREASITAGTYKCPAGVKQCEAGDRDLFFASELVGLANGNTTDWVSMILQPGQQASNQLAVQGGNDRTQYAVSGNLVRQDGIIKGQDFDRKSMRVNVETQANSRLRFGASALLSRSDQSLGRGDALYSESLQNSPLPAAFDSAGKVIYRPTPDGQRVNPLSDIANDIDERQRTRAFGTLFGALNIATGLDLRVNFGPDISFARRGQFRGAETQARGGANPLALLSEDRIVAYTLDNILTYKRDLGANHRIDATALVSTQNETFESNSATVSGLPYEHQRFYNLGSGTTIDGVASQLREWSLQSYMGRVNYAFLDRYLLTLTARQDGSSRLAPGNKWALFPSVALGWQIGDEPFLRDRNWFSNLKLRASYGRTGNTSVDPYQTQGNLARTAYGFGDVGAFGFRPNVLPNPSLKWEKTDQVDVGLEFGILDDRISGVIDAYRAFTHDLLMNRQLPASSGFAAILQNIGETRNTGLELALNTIPVRDWRGLRWTVDLQWSKNKNEIVSLYGGKKDDVGNRWFIGQPINDPRTDNPTNNVFYEQRFGGIWQLADSVEARKYGQQPGQIRVVDINGDGQINDADRSILGSTYPSWTGSINTRFEFRGFDASALAITRQNYMVNNEFLSTSSTLAGRYNVVRTNYWLPTNPSNENPRPNVAQEFPVYGGTRAFEDASFWRIRNITLGYTIPASLLKRAGGQSVRIYGTAQDPFLFTNFKGLDPEGRTSAGTPSTRTVLIGATATF